MITQPDTRPGEYYVTAFDGSRYAKLLGPFTDDHQAALNHVEKVRAKAEQIDPRAVFYAFGTCRIPPGDSVQVRAGVLNRYFGLPTYPQDKS